MKLRRTNPRRTRLTRKITIVATDGAGNKSTRKLAIRIKRA
jgi:hypothetical protein